MSPSRSASKHQANGPPAPKPPSRGTRKLAVLDWDAAFEATPAAAAGRQRGCDGRDLLSVDRRRRSCSRRRSNTASSMARSDRRPARRRSRQRARHRAACSSSPTSRWPRGAARRSGCPRTSRAATCSGTRCAMRRAPGSSCSATRSCGASASRRRLRRSRSSRARSAGRRSRTSPTKRETPINADFVLRFLLARGVRPRAVLRRAEPGDVQRDGVGVRPAEPGAGRSRRPGSARAVRRGPAHRRRSAAADHRRRAARPVRRRPLAALRDAARSASGALRRRRSRERDLHARRAAGAAGARAAARPRTPRCTISRRSTRTTSRTRTPTTFCARWPRNRIPAIVVLPPMNHALLHRYVDNAAYRANSVRLAQLAAPVPLRGR